MNPSPPAGSGTASPRLFWGTLFAAAVLLVLRRPELVLNPQFWAEDGRVFFKQMHEDGWRSLSIAYQGYYHLLPRLIAALGACFDPSRVPALYFASSFVLNLAAIAWVFSPRIDLPRRSLIALAFVLVPHTGEVLLNITNLQWVLAPGLLLLLLSRDPETPLQWAFDLLALVLLGLTGPFVVIWLPFFAWRVWRRRSFASLFLGLIAALAAGVQISAYLQFTPPPSEGLLLAEPLLRTPGLRIWGSLLLPKPWTKHVPTFVYIAISLFAWGLAFFLSRNPPAKRELRLVLLLSGGLIICAAIYKFRFELNLLQSVHNGDRYFYIPKLLLLWFFIFELGSPETWRRRLSGIFLSVCLIASISGYRAKPMVDYHWQNYMADIRAGREVVVPINPPGWNIHFKSREAE